MVGCMKCAGIIPDQLEKKLLVCLPVRTSVRAEPMVYRIGIELLVISIMILLSIILIATARNKDIEVEKKKKK